MNYEEAFNSALAYFDGDELAANVFLSKYALTDPDGDIKEPTPEHMHRRLAKEFARIEAKYPNAMSEDEIFSYLDRFKYIIPQGSPMSAIGNPYQVMSLSNCFVIESPHDSYGGILLTDQQQAQLMKRRGGVGFDISTIRPKGLPTTNAAKTTDGIGVFMERFSNTTREVAQGGRRGALMLTLSVHHPDVETFINIKKDLTKVTGANISLRLSDEFMEAVKADTEYTQRWPIDSDNPEVVKSVRAVEVWDQIISAVHQMAEPGLLFWDTVKRRSATDDYEQFKTVSTNPCVTGDTWILTSEGPRRVLELLRSPFMAVVDGQKYSASPFWETGIKNVIQLITNDGQHIRLTENHKLMTPNGWVEAGQLNVGDEIRLHDHTGFEWDGLGTNDEGYLLGHFVGDGTFENTYPAVAVWENDPGHEGPKDRLFHIVNALPHRSDFKGWNRVGDSPQLRIKTSAMRDIATRFGLSHGNKTITDAIEGASSDFAKGFLRGLFDADGHVEGKSTEGGVSIRLSQSNLELLRSVQRMLGRFGIRSAIRNMKSAGEKEIKGTSYYVQESFRLVISGSDTQKFIDIIGFENKVKLQKWIEAASDMKRGFYNKKETTWIAHIIEEGPQRVYDCTVDEVHAFDANGFYAHNCGEIVLSPGDSCRLMTMNTLSFVDNPFTPEATFDFRKFFDITVKAQQLMDDMVDIEIEQIDKIIAKIESDPEPDEVKSVELNLWHRMRAACVEGRRTGLGVTAIGDTLAALGLRYGSEESIDMVEKIYKQLAIASYSSSISMAKHRGAFPAWDYEKEKNNEFIRQVIEAADEGDDHNSVQHQWETYGRRNIACNTTAPTGSVSMLTQTTSGIEPAFLISYTRRKKINPSDKLAKIDFVDELGDKWQEFTVYHHGFKSWMDITGETSYEKSPYFNATSADIDWVGKVKVQAAAQKWVDHAISNTTNVPEDIDIETVKQIYMTGWESGCKGVTIYRDGSRSGVLVSESKPKTEIPNTDAPKRPKELECDVYHMTVHSEKWTMFVGLLGGRPYELFGGLSEHITLPKRVKAGKIVKENGNSTHPAKYNFHYDYDDPENEVIIKDITNAFNNATNSAFTRTISLALRHGADVRYVVEQIQKGAEKEDGLFTFSKACSRVLKHYIQDGIVVTGKTCSNCQSTNIIYEEGCNKCVDCGSSKCG